MLDGNSSQNVDVENMIFGCYKLNGGRFVNDGPHSMCVQSLNGSLNFFNNKHSFGICKPFLWCITHLGSSNVTPLPCRTFYKIMIVQKWNGKIK